MFVELNSILDIGDENLTGHLIGISESSADGNFLLHHFISLFLKKEIPLCLISLAQSFNHFNTIGQKFGLNLNSLKTINQLRFVEGLKILGQSLLDHCTVDEDERLIVKDDKPFSFVEPIKLKNFKTYIEKMYSEIKQLTCKSPVIIFDNLSILLTIGYTVKEIIALVHYLNEVIKENSGALVLFCDNGKSSHDEDNELLWKYIAHTCTLQLEVSGLDSGYCKDVHGELAVEWKKSLLSGKTAKKMQFKVTDKNVTFFAAGMSSAVL